MKVTIASTEYGDFIQYPDDPDFKYIAQFKTVRNEKFDDGQMVIIDNHHFEACEFGKCHLVYSGGLFAFSECEFSWEASLSLTGAAKRGQMLAEALSSDMEDVPIPFRGI